MFFFSGKSQLKLKNGSVGSVYMVKIALNVLLTSVIELKFLAIISAVFVFANATFSFKQTCLKLIGFFLQNRWL